MPFFNHRFLFAFFLGELIPLQEDKSTGIRPEIPIDDGPPPPTALVQQFSASSAAPQKKVPSLQHCFLSDGCFDVQFLQRQVTAWECSLWRTSTTLKLIHGVGESLSVSKKAHAAVATGIEQNWCQDVFMAAKSLWIRNCRSSNPTSASGGIFT
jgi:hypothetical protein